MNNRYVYPKRPFLQRKTTKNWEVALLWVIVVVTMVLGGIPHV